MAEDIRIDELAKLASTFKRAQELPDVFAATITQYQLAEDKTGRKCLYLTLQLEDGSRTKIKYTPMHLQDLVADLARLRITRLSQLVGRKFIFRRRQYRIGYARHFPTEEVKEK